MLMNMNLHDVKSIEVKDTKKLIIKSTEHLDKVQYSKTIVVTLYNGQDIQMCLFSTDENNLVPLL